PTLSMQIQKLEESLGAKIFDRSRQPVVPTEVGEKIIRQARVVLNESKKIPELLQEEMGVVSGELRLGVSPTVAAYLLPDVLTNIVRRYQQLKLEIGEHTTERMIKDRKTGRLDCGIVSTHVQENGIEEMTVYYETFVAYVSEKGPLFEKKIVTT